MDQIPSDDSVKIYYDGDCPLCRSYAGFVRLKKSAGTVILVDLRAHLDVVATFRSQGHDVNDGMVVAIGGQQYFGADAMHALALLSTGSGVFNRVCAVAFRTPVLARIFYPVLRGGRNVLLFLLGRGRL